MSLGVTARELSDDDLRRELAQLKEKADIATDGTAHQQANHRVRTDELEAEFVRRFAPESDRPAESDHPAESQKAAVDDRPADDEQPADAKQPADAEQPAEAEQPAGADAPAEPADAPTDDPDLPANPA